MNLLSSVASNIVSIDLKNLVTKPEVENICFNSYVQLLKTYLSPPRAAGDPLATRHTNTPLLTDFTFNPILFF